MAITIENKTITIATSRLTAVFEGPDLLELRNPQGKLLAGRGEKPLPALTRELSELDGPLAVGGEGLNEMTMRHQSFAQAHLFNSHHHNCPHLAELDPVPVGDFLYGDLCKTMAYTNIGGETPESRLRLDLHERLGALPSLIVRKPEQVLQPNDAVRRVLERATS